MNEQLKTKARLIEELQACREKLAGFESGAETVSERRRAEEALRFSEEKYSKAFHSSPDSITISSFQTGLFIEVNEGFERIFGFPRSEAIGCSSVQLKVYADAEGRNRLLEILDTDGSVRDREVAGRRKSGELFIGLLSMETIDIGGERCIVTTVRDITERKQAEKELREAEIRYRTLFENANDAIFMMDENRFIECNPKTLEMFGCTREQILGHTPLQFSPPEQPDGSDSTGKALKKIASAMQGEPQQFEWRHTRYDGTPFETEVMLNRLEISGRLYLQAIVRDISGRKRAEERLRTANMGLVKALAEVKTLSGMLPICAGCKKIRDDQGYWDQIETYIVHHTDATFTHGLCPDCMKKYFPDNE